MMESQLKDMQCKEINECIKSGDANNFNLGKEVELCFIGRLYVPKKENLRHEIMKEAHQEPYSFHPGSVKMHREIRNLFWWSRMKNEISEFVMKCLTYRRVKTKHQVSFGQLHLLEIPKWKWDRITMDFVSGFPISASKKNFLGNRGSIDKVNQFHGGVN